MAAALEGRLAAIPFGTLIGGPLDACIEAQQKSALVTVDFIKKVGLDADDNVRNITFKYKDTGGTDRQLEVPILTVLPIPFIKIDDISINFKASMSTSEESSSTESTSTAATVGVEASASYWFAKAKMSASVSSKKDSTATQNSKYSVEYTMDVNVHAGQDDMPAGMAAVLGILNKLILPGDAASGGTRGGGTRGGGTGGGTGN